jgi:hypothetical protein
MKIFNKILLIFCCVNYVSAAAEIIQVGDTVLADCHGFFAKGKIKRKQNDRYVIHFNKDARPIMCVPFAWDRAFIVNYKPVEKHVAKLVTNSGIIIDTTEEAMLKTNDILKITFKVRERDAMLRDKYTITAMVKEININGAALLEAVSGTTKAKQAFNLWVGTNYVSLDFSRSLKADRLTFLEVTK